MTQKRDFPPHLDPADNRPNGTVQTVSLAVQTSLTANGGLGAHLAGGGPQR